MLLAVAGLACEHPAAESSDRPVPAATLSESPASGTESDPAAAVTEPAVTPHLDLAAIEDDVASLCSSETLAREVAASRSETLTEVERRQLLAARRQRLRTALVATGLARIVGLRRDLQPFLAQGEAGLPPLPGQCSNLERHDAAAWAALRAEEAITGSLMEAHRRTAALQWSGPSGLDGIHAHLLYFAYESALLELLGGDGWKHTDLLPGGVTAPEGEAPPLYLVNPPAGLVASAELRQHAIRSHYPLLTRPARQLGPIVTATFDQALFDRAFLRDGTDRRAQVIADVQPLLSRLHDELSGLDRAGLYQRLAAGHYLLPEELTSQQLSPAYDLEQRRYLAAWQKLAREVAPQWIGDKVRQVLQEDPGAGAALRQEVHALAAGWLEELGDAARGLCERPDRQVELDAGLLALHLSSTSGPRVTEDVDAYCNSGWGHTADTITEAALAVGGYVAVAVGGLLVPHLTLPVLGWNALGTLGGTALVASHVQQLRRNLDALALESALYSPAVWQRNAALLGRVALPAALAAADLPLALRAVAVIRSATMTVPRGEWLLDGTRLTRDLQVTTRGWRLLVPYFHTVKQALVYLPLMLSAGISTAQYLRTGKNPLTEVGFYEDLFATQVMLLFGANSLYAATSTTLGAKLLAGFLGSIYGVGVYLAVDDAFQKTRLLVTGELPHDQVRNFLINWIPLMVANNVLVTTSVHFLDLLMGERAAGPLGITVQFLWKIMQGWAYYNVDYATYSRMLAFKDMSFFEALTALRLEDISFVQRPVCERVENERLRRICEQEGVDEHDRHRAGEPLLELTAAQFADLQAIARANLGPQPALEAMAKALPRIRALARE
jgi:hypothetical protein